MPDILWIIPLIAFILFILPSTEHKTKRVGDEVVIKSEEDLIREFPDAPPRADAKTRKVWEKRDEAEIERYSGQSLAAIGD